MVDFCNIFLGEKFAANNMSSLEWDTVLWMRIMRISIQISADLVKWEGVKVTPSLNSSFFFKSKKQCRRIINPTILISIRKVFIWLVLEVLELLQKTKKNPE